MLSKNQNSYYHSNKYEMIQILPLLSSPRPTRAFTNFEYFDIFLEGKKDLIYAPYLFQTLAFCLIKF